MYIPPRTSGVIVEHNSMPGAQPGMTPATLAPQNSIDKEVKLRWEINAILKNTSIENYLFPDCITHIELVT